MPAVTKKRTSNNTNTINIASSPKAQDNAKKGFLASFATTATTTKDMPSSSGETTSIRITPTTSPSTCAKFPPLSAIVSIENQNQDDNHHSPFCCCPPPPTPNTSSGTAAPSPVNHNHSNTNNMMGLRENITSTSYDAAALSFDCHKLDSNIDIQQQRHQDDNDDEDDSCFTQNNTNNNNKNEQDSSSSNKSSLLVLQETSVLHQETLQTDDLLEHTPKNAGCTSLLTPTSVQVSSQHPSSSSYASSKSGSRRSSTEIKVDEQEAVMLQSLQQQQQQVHHHPHQFVVSTPPTTIGAQFPSPSAFENNNNSNHQVSPSTTTTSSSGLFSSPKPLVDITPTILKKVTYTEVQNCIDATIVDQCTIDNIRAVPPTPNCYRSEHQRGNVVLGTAHTFSGKSFTVQRLMVGQLERGFLHQLGFHALGRLLSFVSGDDVLLFGYPMECPKKVVDRHSPAMLGLWLPVDGLNVRLVDLQRMRVMFAEEGILCATDSNEQLQLLDEVERRRQQHSIMSPNSQQRAEAATIWGGSSSSIISCNTAIDANNHNNTATIVAVNQIASFLGLPESPVSLEPARSPPGQTEAITVQLPVILYRAPQPHPVAAMNTIPFRGFRPFVDTTHRKKDFGNKNNSNSNNKAFMMMNMNSTSPAPFQQQLQQQRHQMRNWNVNQNCYNNSNNNNMFYAINHNQQQHQTVFVGYQPQQAQFYPFQPQQQQQIMLSMPPMNNQGFFNNNNFGNASSGF